MTITHRRVEVLIQSDRKMILTNGGHLHALYRSLRSQPSEKRKAAQISAIRDTPSRATRFPKRCWEIVTALWRFTAQSAFIPSSGVSITSDGTPRIVDVIGATVTVDKYAMALSRVSTTTGLFLSGGANW
jgi:hypothetical protein